MASVLENEKGFKVIEVSPEEMLRIGCGDVCDKCARPIYGKGCLVSVLNMYFCQECFDKWYESEKYDPRDSRIETAVFDNYKQALNI